MTPTKCRLIPSAAALKSAKLHHDQVLKLHGVLTHDASCITVDASSQLTNLQSVHTVHETSDLVH